MMTAMPEVFHDFINSKYPYYYEYRSETIWLKREWHIIKITRTKIQGSSI